MRPILLCSPMYLWEIGMGVAVKGRGARGGGLEVLLGGATR